MLNWCTSYWRCNVNFIAHSVCGTKENKSRIAHGATTQDLELVQRFYWTHPGCDTKDYILGPAHCNISHNRSWAHFHKVYFSDLTSCISQKSISHILQVVFLRCCISQILQVVFLRCCHLYFPDKPDGTSKIAQWSWRGQATTRGAFPPAPTLAPCITGVC